MEGAPAALGVPQKRASAVTGLARSMGSGQDCQEAVLVEAAFRAGHGVLVLLQHLGFSPQPVQLPLSEPLLLL